jgi:hypothetical protein
MPLHRRPWVWLCALGFALRLATVAFPPPSEFDVAEYSRLAASVLEGRGYTREDRTPDTQWMPLTVVLHMIGHLVSPPSLKPLVMRFIWVLLGTATVAVAFHLARQRWGSRVALLFAGAMAVYPFNLSYGMSASTETPNVLLLMLAAWLAARRAPPLAVGLCFGAACLCRATDLGFLPLLAAWVWHGEKAGDPPVSSRGREGARRLAFFLAGFLVCAGPWALRNSLVEGTFVPLSSFGLREAWRGTTPHYRYWVGDVPRPAGADPARSPFSGRRTDYADALQELATRHTGEFFSMVIYKTYRFWSPPLWTTRIKSSPLEAFNKPGIPPAALLPGLVYLGVLAGALGGVIWAVWRGRWREISPVVAWTALGYASNLWFGAVVRYRYACGAEACLVLLASWLIVTLSRPHEPIPATSAS